MDPLVHLVVVDGPALKFEGGDGGGIDFQDAAQLRRGAVQQGFAVLTQHQVFHKLRVFTGFGDGKHRPGVFDNPFDLTQGGGAVDGNAHGPGGPNGKVEQGPFVAGFAQQRNAVTLLHTIGDEPLGHLVHLGNEFGRGHVHPLEVLRPRENHPVGTGCGTTQQGGEAGVGFPDGVFCGSVDFLHGAVPFPWLPKCA